MKPYFVDIDSAILMNIRAGVNTYAEICRKLEGLARTITTRKDWRRVVDSRLQVLRKRRCIHFKSKEWLVHKALRA